jgi:hypothetical protein
MRSRRQEQIGNPVQVGLSLPVEVNRRAPGPIMKEHYDPWYVRLPDGRTIKAKSTASVRHHIEAGHIPLNSMVRRDSSEEWVNLVWAAEFADLGARAGAHPPSPSSSGATPVPRSGVAARLDPMRLQTVGVRGLIDELIAALDSALTRSKMLPAFAAAVLIYLGFFAARVVHHLVLKDDAPWLPLVAGTAFAVLVLSILNAVLSKLTHLELSTMRPAQLKEALASFSGYAIPALIANVFVAGVALGLLFLLQRVPIWADRALADAGMGESTRDLLFTPIYVVVLLLSILFWLIVGLCWLLTPAIVVEESSWLAGIREWRQLLREQFGRIVVYEGLTILLGIAISLPLILAVSFALYGGPSLIPAWPISAAAEPNWIRGAGLAAIHGLTAGPLLALLAVANVFIYLNLRYEQTSAK